MLDLPAALLRLSEWLSWEAAWREEIPTRSKKTKQCFFLGFSIITNKLSIKLSFLVATCLCSFKRVALSILHLFSHYLEIIIYILSIWSWIPFITHDNLFSHFIYIYIYIYIHTCIAFLLFHCLIREKAPDSLTLKYNAFTNMLNN